MFLNRKAFLLGVEPERIRKQSSHGCLQILAFLDSMGLVLHDLGTKCSLVIILNTKKVTTQQYNTNYTRTLRNRASFDRPLRSWSSNICGKVLVFRSIQKSPRPSLPFLHLLNRFLFSPPVFIPLPSSAGALRSSDWAPRRPSDSAESSKVPWP